MYIVRDIFQVKFGEYKSARKLLDQAYRNGWLPDAKSARILTDFTGNSYRLIFEEGYDTLSDYEQSLRKSLQQPEWRKWYDQFTEHVEGSHREILQQVM